MGELVARLSRKDDRRVLCGFPRCGCEVAQIEEATTPEGIVWRRMLVLPPGCVRGADGVWVLTRYNQRRWEWERGQRGRPGALPAHQNPRWRTARLLRGRVRLLDDHGNVIEERPLRPAGGTIPELPARVRCPEGHESLLDPDVLRITYQRQHP